MKTAKILLWLAAMLAAPSAFAQQSDQPPARELRVARIEGPIKIDGLVTEDFWQDLDVATDFIQQNPDEGQLSTERTEIRVGFELSTGSARFTK